MKHLKLFKESESFQSEILQNLFKINDITCFDKIREICNDHISDIEDDLNIMRRKDNDSDEYGMFYYLYEIPGYSDIHDMIEKIGKMKESFELYSEYNLDDMMIDIYNKDRFNEKIKSIYKKIVDNKNYYIIEVDIPLIFNSKELFDLPDTRIEIDSFTKDYKQLGSLKPLINKLNLINKTMESDWKIYLSKNRVPFYVSLYFDLDNIK